MSERPPVSKLEEIPQTAEEKEREEMWKRHELWMANNPVPENPSETQKEKAVVAECEAMMDSFEQSYNLEALRAITQFDSREERRGSIRQPAFEALSFMFMVLKYLSGSLHSETREALGVRYDKLSNAVGNIIDIEYKGGNIFDVVVHNRRTPYPGDELPR